MELLNRHVTVREFQIRALDAQIIESILFSGIKASNTGNMQSYSIIVTQGDENKELIPLHFNQSAARTAPVLLTFVADFNRFSKWCTMNRASPGFDNFSSFYGATIDASLVAQNVCVAAENLGLGICYLGTTIYNAKGIIEALNLPKLTFPVTTVAVGYPSIVPDLVDRLPLRGTVHFGTYRDYSDTVIQQIYEVKEQLESSKQFVKENAKATLAQVFTDIRYKKEDNELVSEKMIEVLKEQGFLPIGRKKESLAKK